MLTTSRSLSLSLSFSLWHSNSVLYTPVSSSSVWMWMTYRTRVRRTQQLRWQWGGETWPRYRLSPPYSLFITHSNTQTWTHHLSYIRLSPLSLQVWALASAATSVDLSPDSDPDADTPWARHPFGRHLLETLWVAGLTLGKVFSLNWDGVVQLSTSNFFSP